MHRQYQIVDDLVLTSYVSLAASLRRLFKECFSVSRAFCVYLQ